MNPKTTIPISEARKKIFELANEVQKPGNYYTFTEKGRPKAVLLSAEEFSSILETIDILSDSNILNNIKKAEDEYKRGEYKTWEEVKKEIGYSAPQATLMVCEKPKKKYRKGK